MTRVTFFQNHDGRLTGFDAKDHAGYAEEGEDIVCAAISALVINTVNSLDALTSDPIRNSYDEENAAISLRIEDEHSDGAELLLRSLLLGLSEMENDESYKDFIDLIIEEV